MIIVDIKDMPGYNPSVKNGIDSVTTNKVYPSSIIDGHPYCVRHDSLLKVSRDGIWRCGEPHCSNGCYQTNLAYWYKVQIKLFWQQLRKRFI